MLCCAHSHGRTSFERNLSIINVRSTVCFGIYISALLIHTIYSFIYSVHLKTKYWHFSAKHRKTFAHSFVSLWNSISFSDIKEACMKSVWHSRESEATEKQTEIKNVSFNVYHWNSLIGWSSHAITIYFRQKRKQTNILPHNRCVLRFSCIWYSCVCVCVCSSTNFQPMRCDSWNQGKTSDKGFKSIWSVWKRKIPYAFSIDDVLFTVYTVQYRMYIVHDSL